MKELIKERLKEEIFKRLKKVPDIISVTLVGSYVDRDDLSGISDIDTIVICKHFSNTVFNWCLDTISSIDLQACGLDEYRLKINATFGPLKFDEPKLAVIHLMVYDVQSHRQHVMASPFTCLDWERSQTMDGIPLQQIFRVGKLQPRDFMEARRGLENYLEDLQNGCVSYRSYEFQNEDVQEVKKFHPLDQRHRGEYAFHIVRNLLLNELKLISGENRLCTMEEMEQAIQVDFREQAYPHIKKLRTISKLKNQRSSQYPEWSTEWASEFATAFQKIFSQRWSQAKTVYFARHAQTKLNNGTFLGRSRDPGLLEEKAPDPLINCNVEKIYSSPSRRCFETAMRMIPNHQVTKDERLLEIDYGLAEGMDCNQLLAAHPKIAQAWKQSEDPRFPDGENTEDVLRRLRDFQKDLVDEAPCSTLVLTHNVVLRCLLGEAHGLPMQSWHRLQIPHSVLLEFKLLNGHYYPNVPRALLGEIFSNLYQTT